MRTRARRLISLISVMSGVIAAHVYPQTNEETLSGPDSHEKPLADRGYLFGDWAGLRSDLLGRGVSFDLQYVSDSLANVASEQDDRFVAWNRFRGTVDINPLSNITRTLAVVPTTLSSRDSGSKWNFEIYNHALTETLL